MNLAGTVILAIVLAADGGGDPQQPPKPVAVTMIAAQATHEDREDPSFDRDTKAIRAAVADLKQFDTYRKIRVVKANAPFGKETKFPVDAKYTVYLHPLSKDSAGRIECKVRIAEKIEKNRDAKKDVHKKKSAKAKEKNALVCTVRTLPNKQFKLAGLRLKKGRLVVVLTLRETGSDKDST
jgi:hypothetical protein